MKKTLFTVCLVLAFLFAVVGGAYAAEELRLITWSGYTPKVLLDKFEKETGIKVLPTNSSNEEMIAKLRATRGAGFDLAALVEQAVADGRQDTEVKRLCEMLVRAYDPCMSCSGH